MLTMPDVLADDPGDLEAAHSEGVEHRTVGGAVLPGDPSQFRRFISASRPLDLGGIDWERIPEYPLQPVDANVNRSMAGAAERKRK